MRFLLTICLLFSVSVNAQNFSDYLESGRDLIKAERAKPAGTYNYQPAIEALERAVALQADNQEAHYLLGCAYDYASNPDGRSIIDVTRDDIIKSSNEFEKAIKISPKFSGELIGMDPYAKLPSIWGCLAFSYMVNSKQDSARWAFNEGKKRGAFTKFALDYYRQILIACGPKAIFFTYGDFSTMNMWYLQEMENLRRDVVIVNLGLESVPWYTNYLYKTDPAIFSSKKKADDTTQYVQWKTKKVSIPVGNSGKTFSWSVEPDYEPYMLRGGLIFLDIITANKFRRPIYFEKRFDPKEMLGLDKFLKDRFISDQIIPNGSTAITTDFINYFKKYPFEILKETNPNCNSEIFLVDEMRFEFITAINFLLPTDKKQARALYARMQQVAPAADLPPGDDYTRELLTTFADKIKD